MPLTFSPKIDLRIPVRKIVSYHHAGRQRLTSTLDLGSDGMRIETHYPLPDGEELNLDLNLGSKPLRVRGRVAGSEISLANQTASDIEFIGLSEENLFRSQRHLLCLEESPTPEHAFCR